MKVLVTGGAGFIGSNIVEELVEKGLDVVVLDDLYLGSEHNLSNVEDDIEFFNGSVLDEDILSESIEGCDIVFHQAAKSSSPMHQEDPVQGARVNIEGFINTAEAAIDEGIDKIVYASTSSMYGSVDAPHSEDQDSVPTNHYTASKMSRERYAQSYSYNNKIQTTGLRYFSVYGPHEKAKGEFANIVTQFLWKMNNGERPVIWGDGTQTRDLTYVKDIAKANILAAEEKDELDGEIINVGTGKDFSFNEVVDYLNNELGTDIEPKYIENPRDKYVQKTKADLSKAEKLLGYEPSYSFKEGLRKTVNYYRNR